MAFRLTLFDNPKPRVFNYRPIYFDPEKEKWAKRRAQLHAQKETENPASSKADLYATSEADLYATSEADLSATQERLFQRDHGFGSGAHIRGSFQRSLIESRRHSVDNKYIRIIVLLSILLLFCVAIYLSNGLGFIFKSLSLQPIP